MIIFLDYLASSHETLKESYNDKYEFIFPDITLDKNLFVQCLWKCRFIFKYKNT